MKEINRLAMRVPSEKLLDEIKQANECKKGILEQRGKEFDELAMNRFIDLARIIMAE